MEIFPAPTQFRPPNPRFHHSPAALRCTVVPNTEYSPPAADRFRMFTLGMGFVARVFAAQLHSKGWAVSTSSTSVSKKKILESLGYQAYVFDANDPRPEILEIIKNHEYLLVSIPPVVGIGDPMLHHKGLVESILNEGRLRWVAYLSSTSMSLLPKVLLLQAAVSPCRWLICNLLVHPFCLFIVAIGSAMRMRRNGVYGDCGGLLVDEDYPPKPSTELACARLAAEKEWLRLGHNLGIAVHVFRLGGIYGPGRSAVNTILNQVPLSKSQKMRVFKNHTSRVHVDDICQALHASILKPSSGKIYNVVDDDPAPRVEVFEFAQKIVEETFPGKTKTFISPEREESHVAGKASVGEKRVSNARMKNELGVKLLHPTYRSGLRSIIERIKSHELC